MRGLFLLLLISGCVHRTWTKPGSSTADFRVDKYECERDARSVTSNWKGRARVHFDDGFFVECMEARGWALKD